MGAMPERSRPPRAHRAAERGSAPCAHPLHLDAVNGDAATPGQATLEALERANLFLVPLDDERRWYRY